MRINIVCTGNVARSPALEILLQAARPDLTVESSAVGTNAKPGRRCALPMRELLATRSNAAGILAEAHRSRLLSDCEEPDLIVCTARIHEQRLAEQGNTVPYLVLDPPLPDPAFGGRPAYLKVWPMLLDATKVLAEQEIP